MKITTVLFDLDGTLLPMDQDTFIKGYFGGLARRLVPLGYEPDALFGAIWAGTRAMVANDGSRKNEEAFWEGCNAALGRNVREDEEVFAAFYREDFDKVAACCGYSPMAREVVSLVKAKGLTAVLATNPLFPHIATESRIRWAGLEPSDFALYTAYENSHYCKPNPDYYREILGTVGVSAEECLMVGNDVDEDMIAEGLGMRVFLLTDCLINKSGKDISGYPQGGFAELIEYIRGID